MSDDVAERLVRIETKLDSALERLDDHEKRVRRAEHSLWTASGIGVAVMTAISILFKTH